MLLFINEINANFPDNNISLFKIKNIIKLIIQILKSIKKDINKKK
jgi:hypothetical protein